jgi:beta-galactosidase
MKKSVKQFVSAILSVLMLIGVSTNVLIAAASYEEDNGTYTWDLTAISDMDYDEEAFRSTGMDYNGLVIKGTDTANSSISSEGVELYKNSDGSMYIKYEAEKDGTIYVTAKIGKKDSRFGNVMIDTNNQKGADSEEFISSNTENTIKTGQHDITAGTYYIFNGNSAPAYIQEIKFVERDLGDNPQESNPPQESVAPSLKPTNDPSVTLPPIGEYEPGFSYYEDYDEIDPSSGDVGKWIARDGGIKITEDTDSNRYINMNHTASGGRGAYLLLNSKVDDIAQYTMEFDAKLKNSTKGRSQLVLGAADYLIASDGTEEDPIDRKRFDYKKGMEGNYIFMLEGVPNSQAWVLNPGSDNITLELPVSEFLHFEIEGCVSSNQAYLKIRDGDTIIFDAQITPHSDYATPQMLYMLGGRDNADIGIDTIEFKAYYGIEVVSSYRADDEVGISIAPLDEDIRVYAALYSGEKTLESVAAVKCDGKTAKTLKLNIGGTTGDTVKLYQWKDELTPLTNPEEIKLDEIGPRESATMMDMRYAYDDASVSLDGETNYKDTIPYRYYLPEGYDSTKKYPVLVYLHGAGSRGEDNKGQIRNDKHIFNTLLGEEYINNPDTQCIMIAPQLPRYNDKENRYIDRAWSQGSYNYNEVTPYEYAKHVHDIIVKVTEQYNGDTDRIYISGQSMGGYGCWYLAATYPEMFAAAVGLCGAGPIDADGAGKMAEQNMAAWAFHGDKDTTVPTKGSIEMIDALKDFGATNAHLTIMPDYEHDIEHDVFTLIGKQQGIYEWLFKQSRTKNLENKGGEPEPDPGDSGTDPTPTPSEEPVYDAYVTAIYTIDGTADGEVARTESVVRGESGTDVTLPDTMFAARKFSDVNGLYDVYTCEKTQNSIRLGKGENILYINLHHVDGKYYYYEDFEDRTLGDIDSSDSWYHGGAGTEGRFIKCTTDAANASTAVRWYSSGAGSAREKTFVLVNNAPEIPAGEKMVFSADMRIGVTNGDTNHTDLHFSNNESDVLSAQIFNTIKTVAINGESIRLPSIDGSDEENQKKTLSRWMNVNITFDPLKSENNAVITLTPLNDGDKFTINSDSSEREQYMTTVTTTENAITKLRVSICKGYRGAVILDNVALYNTSSEYNTPIMNELAMALNIYGSMDEENYDSANFSQYNIAVREAQAVLNNLNASNKEAKEAKAALIGAAGALVPKEKMSGSRIIVNENPDWIFIKEKNYQNDISAMPSTNSDTLALSGWEGVSIPHTWNAYDGSDGVSGYDKCKSWYRKNMYVDSSYEGKKVYLEFEGSSFRTRLYINGVPVPYSMKDPFGTADQNGVEYVHKGGFNTFRFDVTDYIEYGKSNNVVVSVDNSYSADTLPLGGDYSKEGGIYRNVSLVITNPVHVDMLDDGSSGLYLLPLKKTAVTDDTNKDFTLKASAKIVNNSDSDKTVKIEAVLREPDHYDVPDNEYIKTHLQFNPEDMYTPGGKSVGNFAVKEVTIKAGESYDYAQTIEVINPKLWDGMTNPYRYEVNLKVTADGAEVENMTETMGFRYYRVPAASGINSEDGGVYLNGHKYPINGVGKHQDYGKGEDALGIATTEKEMLSDVALIYEMGANSVRLVHYQHSLHEVELYDKLGITVWSEPALCSIMTNASQKSYDAFEKATLYQYAAMVKQQYNKPSVLFWCFSNELTHEFDDNGKQITSLDGVQIEGQFPSAIPLFEKMQALSKELDPSRLTTYAANKRRHKGDMGTDLTGSNLYPYWYLNKTVSSTMRDAYKNLTELNYGTPKALCLSEVGGAGVVGRTLEYNEDGTVTQLGTSSSTYTSNTTYQAFMHEKILYELRNSCRGLWGVYLWQMFDSANDTVDVNLGGMNTKGLVSYDHQTRKAAYYFYKANWNTWEPFVYIVNTERAVRPSDKTIIRAYSNTEECQLYVNGQPYKEPITDVNTTDNVYDNNHVFMWYDVQLDAGKANTIEIKGINGSDEVCTSNAVNGNVNFTVDGTLLTSQTNDIEIESSTGLVPGENKIKVRTMAKNAPEITSITDLTAVKTSLEGTTVSVLDESGNEITNGKLLEGMTVRAEDINGNKTDYRVMYEDIASGRAPGGASALTDDSTKSSWTASDGSIVIDLGAEYNLNGADILFDSPAAYKIQVSSDNSSYSAVTEKSSVTDKTVSDIFTASGRYVKIKFTGDTSVKEINIYGWRFNNKGNYTIDKNDIYLGQSSEEHDTDEVYNNLPVEGQAKYELELAEAGRVLSEGDKLIVTETHGSTKEYILHMGNK